MKNKKMYWGSCVGAFQVEGGRNLGGRSDSAWDKFTKQNRYIPAPGEAKREIDYIDVAADVFHKYNVDASLMKKMGANSFGYMLDWARLFPNSADEVNQEGVEWTRSFFQALKDKGVMVVPILHRADYPLWVEDLEGGWTGKAVVEAFRKYCALVYKEFGKFSNLWFPMDEQTSFTFGAYIQNACPPHYDLTDKKENITNFLKSVHVTSLCTAAAFEEFALAKKEGYLNNEAEVGIDIDYSPSIPYKNEPAFEEAARLHSVWTLHVFADQYLKGSYPIEFMEAIKEHQLTDFVTKEDIKYIGSFKDVITIFGWNFYRPFIVAPQDFELPKYLQKFPSVKYTSKSLNFQLLFPNTLNFTRWGWPIFPETIEVGARRIQKRYNLPIVVLECGFGDLDQENVDGETHDLDRIEYLRRHIGEFLRLDQEKIIDLRGFLSWTFIDCYSPSGGYRKDYGLVDIDFNSKEKTRTPKLSFTWMKNVIKANGSELFFDENKLKEELKTDIEFAKTLK